LESALLMRRIPFHRFHQIRNQVVAPLQLHVNVRPGVITLHLQSDQPVVHSNDDECHNDRDRQYDPANHRASYSVVRAATPLCFAGRQLPGISASIRGRCRKVKYSCAISWEAQSSAPQKIQAKYRARVTSAQEAWTGAARSSPSAPYPPRTI